jgi:hypothetical protein
MKTKMKTKVKTKMNMKFAQRTFIAAATCVGISGTTSCGKKSTEETADTSSVSSNPVNDMSKLPDLTSLTASTSTSLTLGGSSDAVTGTPPFVKDISSSNMETYFTGTVQTLVAEIKAAKAAQNWDTVKSKVDSFRAANTKCRIVEDTARQISMLNDNTKSMCYLSKMSAQGTGVLTYVSGTKFDDGGFLKPSADGSDSIRQVGMGDVSRVFKIYGTTSNPTGYKLAFAACKAGVPQDYSVLTVDNTLGTFTLTNVGNRTMGQGGSETFDFSVNASLLYDATGGTYTFDKTKERKVSGKNYRSDTRGTNTFNGEMSIADDLILSKLFIQQSFTSQDPNGGSVTMSNTQKGVSYARFSGTDMSNIVVYEGAGYQYGKGSSSGVSSQTFENEAKIGFEFNNTASPNYASVTSGTYVDKVTTISDALATTTPFSIGAAPTAPTSLPADATTLCTATPTTIARISMDGAAVKAIMESCEGKRSGFGGSICESIRTYDGVIMSIMNDRRSATGKTGVGN